MKTIAAAPDPARLERRVTLLTVSAPLAAFIVAVVLLWHRAVGWPELGSCAAMYLITVLGVTMGFHRLFTHRSFVCVEPLRWMLAIAGSMEAQGPLFYWVACHRRHYQHSDDEGDPHSPHAHGHAAAGVLRGWWHAHVGWMFTHAPKNYFRFVNDVLRDPVAAAVHRRYLFWVTAGLMLPGLIAEGLAGSVSAFWPGVLWGGFVRLFLVRHVTWSVNSMCHLFGSAPFATGDESRNNAVVALLSLGEGWHNNHHAFPSSARHGLRWWEIDPTYLGLRALAAIGLVWDLRTPLGREPATGALAEASR